MQRRCETQEDQGIVEMMKECGFLIHKTGATIEATMPTKFQVNNRLLFKEIKIHLDGKIEFNVGGRTAADVIPSKIDVGDKAAIKSLLLLMRDIPVCQGYTLPSSKGTEKWVVEGDHTGTQRFHSSGCCGVLSVVNFAADMCRKCQNVRATRLLSDRRENEEEEENDSTDDELDDSLVLAVEQEEDEVSVDKEDSDDIAAIINQLKGMKEFETNQSLKFICNQLQNRQKSDSRCRRWPVK